MRIILEPFVAEHGVEILGAAAEPMLDWLIKAECCGPATTGRLEDGRILGAAGFTLELPQVATAWLLPTDLVKTYPVAFHRTIVREFRIFLQAHPDLRCIHASTDAARPEREAWITRLGYEKVGSVRTLWPTPQRISMFTYLVRNGHGT